MLIQERINGEDVVLKTFIAIDDNLQEISQASGHKLLPKDPRGQKAHLNASEIITMMILGAWRGLTDKAKVYYYMLTHHKSEFPHLVSYSKFVEATNRVLREVAALVGKIITQNRALQGSHPVVFQDSTAAPVCKVSRAKQHKTFRAIAHKSKTGGGYYYGLKLHLQCDQEGRITALRLTAANVDDRKMLDPMTKWINVGIVVGDKGYLSADKAYELGSRNVQLITGTRKNMKKLATPFQLAALQARHRVEMLCTQMTKPSLLAVFVCWNHIMNLNFITCNNYSIN